MPRRLPAALVAAALLVASSAAAQPAGFQRLVIPQIEAGKPVIADPPVAGYLFKPDGEGRFPAVILMHGCDGLGWGTAAKASWVLLKSYAERYRAQGYAALVLDSFAPRRVGYACGEPTRVTPVQRAWDAFSAARQLVALGIADPDRLVLQGDSHGGWSTLMALARGRWSLPEHFAAGIAWYPYCGGFQNGFGAPLLILIGEADDWTPAALCRSLADRLKRANSPPEPQLALFPGATHAYDFPLGPRTNRLGHRMAYGADATAASWRLIESFLAAHVAPAR
jgi:dienelactone hydrolase